MSLQEQQTPVDIQEVAVPVPAYGDNKNIFKRNSTISIVPEQTNESQPNSEAAQAQEKSATEEKDVNPEPTATGIQAKGENLSDIEKEILFLKEIVLKLRGNYERAVLEIEQLRQNKQTKLEENEEYVALKQNYEKSAARVEELEALLITEKLNNMVSVSKEKVDEIKNSEKVLESIDAAQGASENAEEVQLVACSSPSQAVKESVQDVKPAENSEVVVDAVAALNIELSNAQNELTLLKAELEQLKEQNAKLQNQLEKQAIDIAIKTQLEEKIALHEIALEEQKNKGGELALLLEAERAKVIVLTEKLEALEAEKLMKVEEPVLVACGVKQKEPDMQAERLAELERQIMEQSLANQKLENEKTLLAKQLEEAKKTEVKIASQVQVPTERVETTYYENTAAPTKQINLTLDNSEAQRTTYSTGTNANYNYETSSSNYNRGNYVSTFSTNPTSYVTNNQSANPSASVTSATVVSSSVAPTSVASSYKYSGATSNSGTSGYSGSSYYQSSSVASNSSTIPLVSASNVSATTSTSSSYKSPNTYSKSINSTATNNNNYTSSSENITNNYKSLYSSTGASTATNNNSYYSTPSVATNNYISSYASSSSANGDLVLSASSNPNKKYGQASYSTFSGNSNSYYPSTSYTSGASQALNSEQIDKRISQETDDIVAKVLKESNISLGSTSYINQPTNYVSSASASSSATLVSSGATARANKTQYASALSSATLVSSGAPATANKSLYASTYYSPSETKKETDNIMKNKSVYGYRGTN